MTDRLWLAPAWRARLDACGLRSLDAFLQWSDGRRITGSHGVRETLRIPLPSASGPAQAGYLKRYAGYTGRRNYFRHAVRLRREALSLRWLADRALPVPPVLAWGIRSRWGLVTASFLLTAEIEGAEPLEAAWQRAEPAERRRLLAGAADLAGRMHLSAFTHGNFYARNVLVSATGALWLIDCPNGRINPIWPIRPSGEARDLLGLLDDLGPLSVKETAAFLDAYGGARWPEASPEAKSSRLRRLMRRVRWHATARRFRLRLKGKMARGAGALEDGIPPPHGPPD